MQDCIPFVHSKTDLDLLEEYYTETGLLRCSLHQIEGIPGLAGGRRRIWLNPGVDGYHWLMERKDAARAVQSTNGDVAVPKWVKKFGEFLRPFKHSAFLVRKGFLARPDTAKVREFVTALLDACAERQPTWISVPQFPTVSGTERNKINRCLAKAAGQWRRERNVAAKFVLPLIFTKPSQYRGKTAWNPKLRALQKSCEESGAEVLWVADASLSDQKGTASYPERFSNLVSLHNDLRECFVKETIAAGPYWGVNLLLWARGLADRLVIGLGSAYQYHFSGSVPQRAKVRLPLPPLRRWAEVGENDGLKGWLAEALEAVPKDDRAWEQFSYLHRHYSEITLPGVARELTARFYSGWIRELSETPEGGRALVLYQQLSSAYVLGKKLPDLPEEGVKRNPAIVAQQLMLNCL